MTPTRQDIVRRILEGRPRQARDVGTAFAPTNIALCKYWGKRNDELNLPVTPSLSVSLGRLGSRASIRFADRDDVVLNGERLPEDSAFRRRLFEYLDLVRPTPTTRFHVDAVNTIPTAAGFASSASGFATVILALDQLFGWNLGRRELSILARLGSGSACRSLYEGFVLWHAGSADDGMDSFAEPLPETWPDLRLGLVVVSARPKPVGSRAAMKRTVESSPLYAAWPGKVASDLEELRGSIRDRDFERFGRAAESNALTMHATMMAAWPPVIYWLPESVATIERAQALRARGTPVYFTMDAGPNVKLLFLRGNAAAVEEHFPGVQVVDPWSTGVME